mgnify:CR=1 FL=1
MEEKLKGKLYKEVLIDVFSVILGMVLIIFKWGDVKIGGIVAKPDFTTWQWYSISICGGIVQSVMSGMGGMVAAGVADDTIVLRRDDAELEVRHPVLLQLDGIDGPRHQQVVAHRDAVPVLLGRPAADPGSPGTVEREVVGDRPVV